MLRNRVTVLEKKLEELQMLMANFQLTIARDAKVEEELRRLNDALIAVRVEDQPAAENS